MIYRFLYEKIPIYGSKDHSERWQVVSTCINEKPLSREINMWSFDTGGCYSRFDCIDCLLSGSQLNLQSLGDLKTFSTCMYLVLVSEEEQRFDITSCNSCNNIPHLRNPAIWLVEIAVVISAIPVKKRKMPKTSPRVKSWQNSSYRENNKILLRYPLVYVLKCSLSERGHHTVLFVCDSQLIENSSHFSGGDKQTVYQIFCDVLTNLYSRIG